ncbi:MAG: hypothetical protein U0670_08650 [Anaerolineae bacterium]
MDLNTFLKLPTESIAQIVRESGPKVCAFPVNGTRRWLMLESDTLSDYIDGVAGPHVAVYRLLFDHGVHTVLAPVYGPDLFERGDDYTKMTTHGLAYTAQNRHFLNLYEECNLRVGFYGDYERYFKGTQYEYLLGLFDEVKARTAHHNGGQILFGICANDPTDTIAALTIDHFKAHGEAPSKNTLIERYYGMPVSPLNFYIGFDKFTFFDTPLVTTGNEDLYFTISPSLYLNSSQLRAILFDHLFTRRMEESDYGDITAEEIEALRSFYQAHRETTFGVGVRHGRFWYPASAAPLTDMS